MSTEMTLSQTRDQIHAFATAKQRDSDQANYYVEMNVLTMDSWWKAIDAHLASREAKGGAVAEIRHFTYAGIARNGESMEAVVVDGTTLLPEGTKLYTHPAAQEAAQQMSEVVQPVEAVAMLVEAKTKLARAIRTAESGPSKLWVREVNSAAWDIKRAMDALAHPRPTGDDGMVSVVAEDANNYCRILTELGMEEEGDPVAEVKRLAGIAERTHESSFQHGVATWMDQCFLPSLYSNMTERGDRLLEEVLELLQSHGYDQSRVATLVDYVYGRPVGEPAQEVGGERMFLRPAKTHQTGGRELMNNRIRAVAWEHTMHMELGQKSRQLTYTQKNPFGEPGRDYSSEYKVTKRKLVYVPTERLKGAKP